MGPGEGGLGKRDVLFTYTDRKKKETKALDMGQNKKRIVMGRCLFDKFV